MIQFDMVSRMDDIIETEKSAMMETFLHQFSVSVLCKRIAQEMNMTDAQITLCERSGILHDVGKRDISSSILLKAGPLNANEREIIKLHAKYGHDTLQKWNHPELAKYVLYHHEREDGEGYFNMKKNEIELPSKIIQVSDVFCALTEDRVYRSGMSTEKALEIMEKEKYKFNSLIFNYLIKIKTESNLRIVI